MNGQSTRSPHDSDDSWKNKQGHKPFRLLLSPSGAPGGWRGTLRIISKVCGCKENDSVPKSTLKMIMAFCTCAQIHLSLLIMSCTISGACAFFTGEVTRTGRLVDWEAGARRWPMMQGLPWTPPLVTWASGNQTKPTQCKPTQVRRTAKQSVIRPPAYSMPPPPQMVTDKCRETTACRAAAGTRLSLPLTGWHGGGLTRNKQPLHTCEQGGHNKEGAVFCGWRFTLSSCGPSFGVIKDILITRDVFLSFDFLNCMIFNRTCQSASHDCTHICLARVCLYMSIYL